MTCKIEAKIESVHIEPGESIIIYYSRWDNKCNKNHPEGPGGYEFGSIMIYQTYHDEHPEIIIQQGKPKIKRIKKPD